MKMKSTNLSRSSLFLALLVLLSGCSTTRTMIPIPSLYTQTEMALFDDLAPELE
mgnify:FL=1